MFWILFLLAWMLDLEMCKILWMLDLDSKNEFYGFGCWIWILKKFAWIWMLDLDPKKVSMDMDFGFGCGCRNYFWIYIRVWMFTSVGPWPFEPKSLGLLNFIFWDVDCIFFEIFGDL